MCDDRAGTGRERASLRAHASKPGPERNTIKTIGESERERAKVRAGEREGKMSSSVAIGGRGFASEQFL